MVLKVEDGGKGLTAQHQENCRRLSVYVRYDSAVINLLSADLGAVTGVKVRRDDGPSYVFHARGAVVLCAGGCEANAPM